MIKNPFFIWSQLLAWKTSRRIVVIESDDWGSERIPNNLVRNNLSAIGLDMESNPYSKYDSLERYEDLECLELILQKIYRDFYKKVKITANFITANPDYERIYESNFSEYFFESFEETYNKRDGNTQVIDKVHRLINDGFIQPQLHGREHVNVGLWLSLLRNGNKSVLTAFHNHCYAIDPGQEMIGRRLMSSLDFDSQENLSFVKQSITEGQTIFKNVFGYPSSTFIAPRHVWSDELNKTFVEENIKAIQSVLYQHYTSNSQNKRHFHFTGQRNHEYPLTYLVRNVFFEPAYQQIDWVNSALRMVKWAFKFHTPAIISMHRINFVGGLDINNRNLNLKKFKLLVENIIKLYPDVEFISSEDLANQINLTNR